MAISYIPLEEGITQAVTGKDISFSTSDAPTLFSSASLIYVFFFVVIVVAASFRYAYAGALRMQGSEKGIKDSKEEFSRVTYGLIGIFSLWLILATVNKDMLSGNIGFDAFKLGPSSSYTGGGTGVITQVSTQTGSGTVANSGSHTYQERLASHNAAVARLAPSNIHTNHGDAACSELQFREAKPKCTSLAFLPEETIQILLNINSACNCNIFITGGTEPGHSTHGEGKRAVDLQITSSNDGLYTYIKNTMTQKNNTAPCNIKYTWHTFTFWDENVGCSSGNTGRHWHVN